MAKDLYLQKNMSRCDRKWEWFMKVWKDSPNDWSFNLVVREVFNGVRFKVENVWYWKETSF